MLNSISVSVRRHLITLTMLYFFFNDTATTEIYTLSLHDALPILPHAADGGSAAPARPARHSARGVLPLRRSPRTAAPCAGAGTGALHLAAAARSVRVGPLPAAERAARGARGSAALARRRPNRPPRSGPRPGG